MPSTVRIELNKLGFDWKNGVIVAEDGQGRQSTPGQNTRYINDSDPLLEYRFSNGEHLHDVPRVFARDKAAIYIPHISTIAGARMVRIIVNPETYVKSSEPLPYPGDD
jgi:hypothetical protein